MKIGFVNPYLDGFGGGERYTLTLASHWSQKHDVRIFWNDASIVTEAQKRFAIDLTRVNITPNIFIKKNLFNKLFLTRQYDLIFFLSDGSIPTSFAKNNILHFQVPFSGIETNIFKLSRFGAVICNSVFTKTHIDARIGKNALVIYPPVRTGDFKSATKKKQILSVGRFSGHFQSKKQQILIEAFRKGLKSERFSGWQLILAGGLLPSDQEFFKQLKQDASGLPIELYANISYAKLIKLYEQSSMYWHAAGFEETDPTLAEHFGISTVEAMAAGCVPLVYNGGGQPEIVIHKKSGFLWDTIDELIDYTVALEQKNSLYREVQIEAYNRSKTFDEKNFLHDFNTLLANIT